jgi:glycerate kinase
MIQKHKRVLLVFDKFKDTLSSAKVCEIVAGALPGVEVRSVPISDGGDGFVDCMHHVLGGKAEKREVPVTDPLGREAKAQYLVDKGTAYVEVANSAGLQMLRVQERDPAFASSVVSGRGSESIGDWLSDQALCGKGGSTTGCHRLRRLGVC